MKIRQVKKAYARCIFTSDFKVYYLGSRETKAHRWLKRHPEVLKELAVKEFGEFPLNLNLSEVIDTTQQ